MSTLIEHWKPVVGFEGFYEISNTGRIWSVPRIDAHNVPRGGHVMVPQINSRTGYSVVHLRKDGKSKLYKVHSLILEAFEGERPDGKMALHKDGMQRRARLSNLRWGTHAENMQDREKHGRALKGERNHKATLTEVQVRQIKALIGTKHDRAIAADFGVTISAIQGIKHGRNWTHVG